MEIHTHAHPHARTPTREHAHTHFFRGSIVYLQHHSGHAGCWKLPLCDDVSEGEEKKKEIAVFTAEIKETEREGLQRGWGRRAKRIKKKTCLLINVGFEAPLLLDPPCTVAVAEGEGGKVGKKKKKLLVFLKAQEGRRRGESGG